MEEIIQSVQDELRGLASKYSQSSKHENVTLDLVSDFKRALFIVLDDETRIKDLQQSTDLKKEMTTLFEKVPQDTQSIFLNQDQDRCCAKPKCYFTPGQTIYMSAYCKEHFMCEKHVKSPCLAHTDSVKDKILKDDVKRAAKNTSTSSSPVGREDSGRVKKETSEKREKVLYQIMDPESFSAHDLSYEKSPNEELTVCKVKTTQGKWVWIPVKAYADLKQEAVALAASNDTKSVDNEVITEEGKNHQNSRFGGRRDSLDSPL
ncbi:hypothetical protein IQ07DRAFT_595773 [Pyrenochaeta sp. DS3sAY3a]|nr:hypothetical protein IQ07DRAFT_595773 [Pyrenochaeta sp. DS3sAY3a]